MFKVVPSRYRKGEITVPLIDRMDVVERDFRNKNNDIVIDYFCREVNEIKLLGKEVYFNPWNLCELEEIIRKVLDFYEKYVQGRRLYNIVRGDISDPTHIYLFSGMAEKKCQRGRSGLTERIIPASKYAVFRYPGSIGLVSRTTEKDYYKWLSVTKLEINKNAGIDYFTEDYVHNDIFYIHIPVL
jgi:AraC family transcriptional regulator